MMSTSGGLTTLPVWGVSHTICFTNSEAEQWTNRALTIAYLRDGEADAALRRCRDDELRQHDAHYAYGTLTRLLAAVAAGDDELLDAEKRRVVTTIDRGHQWIAPLAVLRSVGVAVEHPVEPEDGWEDTMARWSSVIDHLRP